eukprot:282225_1
MKRLNRIVSQLQQTNDIQNNHCFNAYSNEVVIFDNRPTGNVTTTNFRINKEVISSLNNDEILIKILCISIDPYLRFTMFKPGAKASDDFINIPLNSKMKATAIAEIVESRNKDYKIGEKICGAFGVEKYSVINPNQERFIEKMDPNIDPKYYLTYLAVGIGVSSFFGVNYISKPVKPGDIVAVSAASGSVGCIACQLYKNKGAKVIAITGGKYKKEYLLNELKLYACIDYKNENVDSELKKYAPDGVDIFWDNVGGKLLDIVLDNLRFKAQIIVCGQISQYLGNLENDNVYGPKNYGNLAVKSAQMTGFLMHHYANKIKEARMKLLEMVENNSVSLKETSFYGVHNFASALSAVLTGNKMGKTLLYP